MNLIEAEDSWILPIAGKKVTRCLIDYRFALELWGPDFEATIILEVDFVLKISDKVYNLSLDNPTELSIALTMLHKNIQHVEAYKTGRLELTFEDNISVVVEPSSIYEAWQVTSHDGSMIISLPGGGLSIFGKNNG